MSTLATLRNMKIHDAGRLPGQVDVFAYSPTTGEEYSACPGDYWTFADDDVLRDSDGEPMILVRRQTVISDV